MIGGLPQQLAHTSKILNRFYSTKSNLQLLQKLRQETQVSVLKAKEALVKNGNDYEKALAWVFEDAKISGHAKAEKLKGRLTREGLIGVVISKNWELAASGLLPNERGAIVEVNCETDFVSRNILFRQLVVQIASTSLLISPTSPVESPIIQKIPVSLLHSAPIFPHPSSSSFSQLPLVNTIKESIEEMIGKLGENITLRRAAVVNFNDSVTSEFRKTIFTGGYVHGDDSTTGKIGGLIMLQSSDLLTPSENNITNFSIQSIKKLGRDLARQVVGYNPKYVDENDDSIPKDITNLEEYLNENVLLRQISLSGGGSVKDNINKVMQDYKIRLKVLDFLRWECGEGIDKAESNFAAKVMKQTNAFGLLNNF